MVYASDDDAEEQGRRDLEAFDEALARESGAVLESGAPSPAPQEAGEPLALPRPDALSEYLNDPDRMAFRDELEMAAMEEELRRSAQAAQV